MINCPIPNCTHKCRNRNTLLIHLYDDHSKNILARYIADDPNLKEVKP